MKVAVPIARTAGYSIRLNDNFFSNECERGKRRRLKCIKATLVFLLCPSSANNVITEGDHHFGNVFRRDLARTQQVRSGIAVSHLGNGLGTGEHDREVEMRP